MKRKFIVPCVSAILFLCVVTPLKAADSYTLTGKSESTLMGKTEILDSLYLEVVPKEAELSVKLENYAVLGMKNISITGLLQTDAEGNITSWKDIVIKGAPAKVKEIKGNVSKAGADITLKGKAGGLFSFLINYSTYNK